MRKIKIVNADKFKAEKEQASGLSLKTGDILNLVSNAKVNITIRYIDINKPIKQEQFLLHPFQLIKK